MTKPTINWEIGIGTILHAVVLLAGMAVAYGSFSVKFEALAESEADSHRQTTRIEHYLSSKDRNYWKDVAKLEGTQ